MSVRCWPDFLVLANFDRMSSLSFYSLGMWVLLNSVKPAMKFFAIW